MTPINRREAIASVAALTAVPVGLGLATSNPAASACVPDPIFMVIEEHKAARKAWIAALAAESVLDDAEPFRKSPSVQLGILPETSITIGDRTTIIPSRPYSASKREDIDEHFDAEIAKLAINDLAGRAAINTQRDVLLREWDIQEVAAANPALEAAEAKTAATGHAEFETTVELLTTPPTTLAGAVALLRYIEESDTDGEAYHSVDCGDAGEGYEALVSSLLETLTSMVRQ